MRSRLHPALLLALLALAAATATPQEPAIYDVTVARVVRFADADLTRMTRALVTRHVDGDTFVVRIDNPPPGPGASERVRLIGIDTPERGEPWADDATQHVANRIGADPVYLAFDFRRRDRFDRLLAYVYLADGTLLNAELIAAGLAHVYLGDETIHFYRQFERLEADARRRRSGVWTNYRGGIVIVTIRNAGHAEHVVLRNDSAEAVDLSGWLVEDDDDAVLAVPNGTNLAPDETLAICSGQGCVGDPQRSVKVLDKTIWSNRSDNAFLFDADGREIDRYQY